jgi:aspartokinase/homoserine dehydrogenase 1
MRVLKFGGSSLGSPEAIRAADQVIRRTQAQPGGIVVVVSAFQDVTDQLIAVARRAARGEEYRALVGELEARHLAAGRALLPIQAQSPLLAQVKLHINELADLLQGVTLTGELTPRVQDAVMSLGERLSAQITAAHLTAGGIAAEPLDMRPLVRTDAHFGAAHVNREVTYHLVQEHFATHTALQIATGFIGSTAQGDTTTLGRGGSDYTAALLGAALDADEIEIWTDVDGVLTADPRTVADAFTLDTLTYEEAMELAHFGAKVIYPPTIQPALLRKIPLRIKNTFRPDAAGTLIAERRAPSAYLITGLTSISSVALLLVRGSGMIGAAGTAMRLFGALARHQISVILITQASSEHTICVAVDPAVARDAQARIEEEFALELQAGQLEPVAARADCAIIAAVGEGMRERPGIAGTLFSALGQRRINVVAIAQGSSELNISVVVARRDEAAALRAVHDAFYAPDRTDVHLFLAGTGGVGGALLGHIAEQQARLLVERGVRLHLRGVANSRRMLLDGETDIPAARWSDWSEHQEAEPAHTGRFIARMLELRLPNSVLVDCTASDAVPEHYSAALGAGVAVVTANKRGLVAPYQCYEEQRRAARQGRAPFLYETTVGATLPVLAPLRDLLATGDTVLRIEAVLSGTLSYLFNAFDGTQPFSALVRAAQEAGYTEPDPRDDLGCLDVARKLLILARECGQPLELTDVHIEHFLPARCREAPTVAAFYAALEAEDDHFARLRASAAAAGNSLRVIARLEDGRARVALETVEPGHPFARLASTDNVIAFTTARYREQPLVIQGPGAGAELTAAGVLADILHAAARMG